MADSKMYKFGEIYLYSGSSHSGDTKIRPGVISSKDAINGPSDVVQIVPFSTNLDAVTNLSVRRIFSAVATGLEQDSVIMCDKATIIKKSRIKGEAISSLDSGHIEILKDCLNNSHENGPVLVTTMLGA